VLVLEKWGWGGEVSEYRAKSECIRHGGLGLLVPAWRPNSGVEKRLTLQRRPHT